MFKGLAGSRPRGVWGKWAVGAVEEGRSEVRVKLRSWPQGQAGAGGGGCGGCLAAGLGWGTALQGTAPMLLLLGVFPETLRPTAGAAATCEP